MAFTLTKVGALDVRNGEAITNIRRKIAGASCLVGFSDVDASRLAATVSETGRRLLSAEAGASIGVYLKGTKPIEGLALSFPENEAIADILRRSRYFDHMTATGEDGSESILVVKYLRGRGAALDDQKLLQIEELLSRPSREELMGELQSTNKELESHQVNLERTVTERTAELRQNQAQFRLALDHMSGGLFMIDKDFNYQVASPSFTEIYEIPAELVYPGAQLKDTMDFRAERGDYGPGDPKAQVEKRLQGFLDGGVSQIEETLQNGRVVEIFRAPTPEGGIVAVFNDITERKKAEIEFRKSEEQFRGVFESGASGMALLSMDGTYVKVNRKFCEIIGYTEEELYQKTWRDITHPEEIAKVEAFDQEVAAGKNPDFSTERRLVRKDGTIIWTRLSSAQIRDHEGVPRYIFSSNQDITEFKAAEEAVKQSEVRLRNILESSPFGVSIVTDKANKRVYANPQYNEMFGGKRDVSMIDRKRADSWMDLNDLDEYQRAGRDSGWHFDREEYRKRVDGTPWWCLMSSRPFVHEGEPSHMVWHFDITERKEAEDRLAEKEAQLRLAMDNMPGALFVVDENLDLVLVNDRYREFYDHPEGFAVRGKSMKDVLRNEMERGILIGEGKPEEILEQRLASLRSRKSSEFEDMTPDGRFTQIRRKPAPGNHMVTVITDITERKRAEEEIMAQRQQLQDILDNTQQGVALFDQELKLVAWNSHYSNTLNIDESVLEPGLALFELALMVAERGDYGEGNPHELARTRVEQLCQEDFRPDLSFGDERSFDAQSTLTPDGRLVLTYTDITERKRGEEEIRIARDVAEEATKAKAAFLATMSHEIRTPMNGVVGMVDLLRQSKMTDDQRQMIDTVRDSAQSLLTIINDILDFSKIEAGKLDLEEIPISVCDVVEGAGEALAVSARNKKIGLSVYVDPDIPDALVGDQVRLRQILFNFGSNAIKFTEKGKVLIRADKVPSRAKKKVTVRFQVIDDGIGIPKEAQEKLFQAFSQVDASTTRRFGGTGLGLTICQRLTEIMNGEIGVESVPGEGSTFSATITFPVAKEHTLKSDGHDLKGLNVLLAIGDDDMRGLIPRYLEHWGSKVTAIGKIGKVKSLALKAAKSGEPFNVVGLNSAWPLAERISLVESLAMEKTLSSTGYVLACQDRVRAKRKEMDNTVYVDSDPLRRGSFIRSIAVAAGRASPEVEYDESEITLDVGDAPTVAEAEDMGQLILLAEDNLTNQDVIRRQLTMLGYALEIANDGKEALELLQSKSFAILLTDCHMPNMDGFELTETIRKSEKDKDVRFPIVAITASVMKEEVDRCMASGMDDCLAKPLEMKTLKETLHKLMPAPSGDVKPKAKVKAKATKKPPAEDRTDKPKAKDGGDGGDGPIDPKALKSVFGDDEATFKEILKEFVEPATSNVGEIEASFAERSADGVAKAAHKLKSSARSVGANDLADLCQTLETAGKAENWDEIDEAAPRLKNVMQEVTDYIKAL